MLIIPDFFQIEESLKLAREYALGFEYNDFYLNLDDAAGMEEKIAFYRRNSPPCDCTLHGAFYDVAVGSADAQIRAVSRSRVAQSVEIGKKLGARAVVFHTNTISNFHLKSYCENWLAENAAYYSGVLQTNRTIGIYIENMFDQSPDLLLRLSEQLCVYPNYGVCLDFAHACLSQTKIEDWVEPLAPYIRHIHLNDCDGLEDSHLALGRGKMDIPGFFSLLEQYRVSGSVLLEVRGIEDQRESLEYLRARGLLREAR
ncbi:MAG: sugar phosphate isomerase/epimerase [Eubacteriales bacterium]|nr:sugar phosphate isomerase/epimerase [Eubacteriales bacterium]